MSSQALNRTLDIETVKGNARYSRVLLIDDNPMDNFVNKKLLESTSFATEVVTHQFPKEALSYLTSLDIEALPELIFLDIMMPEMDGFQFLDEFEKLQVSIQQKCKVIMLSTSDSFKDLNKANKSKFVKKFLNKPLTEKILHAINV
jgi:CheY-like chemotaxis protein